MAILAFLLGATLAVAGFGALAGAINLVPTEMGLLYAVSGVILISAAGVTLAIAALIARLDRIVAPPPAAKSAPAGTPATPVPPPSAPPADDEINFNRSGRLPTLHQVEEAIAHPEPSPRPVGRYDAGGAHYVIYYDGAIEAETEEGAMRFASMEDLKTYIARRERSAPANEPNRL